MIRVSFVCLGNICRSPLAEGVLLHLAAERGLGGAIEACSRGVGDWHLGELADPRMRSTAERHGVTLLSRSELVEPSDFHTCDLLLAMDAERLVDLRGRAPAGTAHKVVAFRSFDPQGSAADDVPDPYYGGPDGFEDVFTIVERTCAALLDRLVEGSLTEPKPGHERDHDQAGRHGP